ncbi:NADH-quinone oxidoreductase subunit J [Anaerolineales bacterium HSG6]|nr:NADH-quinone oxidoreductase subunit J [Anaerolineales bacterium HSG6]MDM8530098.1 NADH-quinone oxidoreductase subunit J [Anaerolineales bacterium HSG25]
MELTIFIIVAVLSVVSALGVIFNKNVVYSALFLLVNFLTIAVFYLMLNAQFLGMVQILVYAGAIVVLILFVVMLLGEQLGEDISSWVTPANGVIIVLALILLTIIGTAVTDYPTTGAKGDFTPELIQEYGQAEMIGVTLFTDYLLSVQLAGVLLLVGIVGVIWLARNDEQLPATGDVPTKEA